MAGSVQAMGRIRSVLLSPLGKAGQRRVLAGIYGLLILVALGGIASYLALRHPAQPDPAEKKYRDIYDRALARAPALNVAELVKGLQTTPDGAVPLGASEEQIAAVERRLGVHLPGDLHTLYRVSNGFFAALQLGPIEQAERPDATVLHRLTAELENGKVPIMVQGADLSPHLQVYTASPAQLANMLQLGRSTRDSLAVVADLNEPLLVPGHPLFQLYSGRTPFALNLRQWLRMAWAFRQELNAKYQQDERDAAIQRERLRDEDAPHLISHLEPLARTLPAGASEAAVLAAERRLGQSLPPDLRALLLQHDGLPSYELLPVADYAPLQQGRDDAMLVEMMGDHGLTGFKQVAVGRPPTRTRLKADDLHGCIVIGEYRIASSDDERGESGPMFLWCPQLASQGLQILDLVSGDAYPDTTALLRDKVAQILAISGAGPNR
jgi:hypothetical protein